MKIIYSEALRQSGDLFALAQQVNRVLEKMIGRYLLPITAEWDRNLDERGRPVLVLRLLDQVETKATQFDEIDLRDAGMWEQRLRDLWGDWLQENSHKRLETLLKSINETIGVEDARQDAR